MAINVKKIAKIALTILLAFIAVLLVGRLIQVTYGSLYFGERAPYLQSMTEQSVIIKWQTLDDQASTVRYGTDIQQLDKQIKLDELQKKHEVTLTQLKPNTRYFYEIPTLYPASTNRWFKTLATTRSQQAVRIWALGDSGKSGENQQKVKQAGLQWMAQNHKSKNDNTLDLWLLLGDIAYTSGTQKQYQKALFDAYPNVIKHNTIWPVYGNHDARRWAYFDIFSLPKKGQSGGVASNTEHYYALDFGPVHLLMLDSQDSSLDTEGEMAQWIKADLANNQAKWTIAVMHHPPYSGGSHNSDNPSDSGGRLQAVREHIAPILEKNGVDVVLSGHSHGYERSDLMRCHYGTSDTYVSTFNVDAQASKTSIYKKTTGHKTNGTLYVVAGSASKLDHAKYDNPAMPHSHAELGSLIIDIKGDELIGHFINELGQEVDFFKLLKSAQKGKDFQCD